MKSTTRKILALSLAVASVAVSGCGKGSATASSTESGEITMWTHNAGNEAELGAIQDIVNAYNESQDTVKVKVQAFPQDSYNDSVISAAAAGKLPCIVDIDGPNVPNWAWADYLAPLDLETDLDKHLPTTLGKWEGKTYSVGYYDVALAMLARKSDLTAADIRIPTAESPWTREEFDDALAKLKATGTWKYPLDLGTGGTGEWLPYAYSPFLQSFGADLINRDDFQSAEGTLNGEKAVEWAKWFRGLVDQGYMAQKSGKDPAADFFNNESAILYTGSWAGESAREAVKEDLVVMPSVDLGEGPRIGGGSWQWGVTSGCSNVEGAMDYLDFSLKPENVAAVAQATGTIPATEEAAAMVPGFEAGGRNDVFRQFSKEFAVLRPETPAYPFIATEFGKATQDILSGADPKPVLDKAVNAIDANIKSNNGYTK